jgi:hypothetical protein
MLRIGVLRSRYELPRAAAPLLRQRLDRAAAEHLAAALDGDALVDAAGDEVWLLRHLHVDLTVTADAVGRPEAVARAWSHQVRSALLAALQRGGDAVVRFDSPAAWTARFAAEVAAGTAWDRWYLAAFSSLRPLPAGRAISEALLHGPGDASVSSVLIELRRSGDLDRVLLALSPGDARRVIAALVPDGPMDASACRALARAVAAGGGVRGPDDPHLPGATLRALAVALAPGGLPPGAGGVAGAVIVLGDLLRSCEQPAALVAMIRERRWAAALRLAGAAPTGDVLAALEQLAVLADGDPGWLEDLASTVTSDPEAGGITVATRFGGLLLVWPHVLDLWPDPSPDAALHRLLVAAELLGPEHVTALLRDPVLSRLCGLPGPPAPTRLAAARATVPVDALATAAAEGPPPDGGHFGGRDDAVTRFCALMLHRFAAGLPGFTHSSPGHLLRNFLDVPASLRVAVEGWRAQVDGPPLQVVLRMAGMTTLCYRLPWPPWAEVHVELRWSV